MKKATLITFFFLLSIVFSYVDPPFAEIIANNSDIARQYNNSLDPSNFSSAVLNIFGETLGVKGTLYIAGFTPIVDNCTNGSLFLIVRKGASADYLKDGSIICDRSRKDGPGCDFDSDGCAEYVDDIKIDYKIVADFALGERKNTSANNSGNVLAIPASLVSAVEEASGNDTLIANLSGNITFTYVVNDQEKDSNGYCITRIKNYTKTLAFHDNSSVYACGKNKVFFLAKPILNEHWYKDSEVFWLLFSQRKIYFVEIEKDGERKNFSLYYFNITKNKNGISEITSIEKSRDFFAGRNLVNISILSEYPYNFSYLYKINYTDDERLGKKEFVITARDVFLGNASREEEIYSRQLSLGNKTETGALPSWETTRRNATFALQAQEQITIMLGLLGVFLVVWAILSSKPKMR